MYSYIDRSTSREMRAGPDHRLVRRSRRDRLRSWFFFRYLWPTDTSSQNENPARPGNPGLTGVSEWGWDCLPTRVS